MPADMLWPRKVVWNFPHGTWYSAGSVAVYDAH
jgi:hypothetical protein